MSNNGDVSLIMGFVLGFLAGGTVIVVIAILNRRQKSK